MRTSAVIRIILWTIVAIILVSILAAGLFGRALNFFGGIRVPNLAGSYRAYEDSRFEAAEKASVKAAGVSSVDIDWRSGAVEISLYDGEEIKFSESSYADITSDYRMRFAVEDSVLKIRFARSGVRFVNTFINRGKTLTLQLPRDMVFDRFSVDAISATVSINGLNAKDCVVDTVSGQISIFGAELKTLKTNSVSGRVDLDDVYADQLVADTISGRLEANGSFQSVSANSVSGSVNIDSAKMPERVAVDTVSGSLTLRIPENDGFEVNYSKVSGSFSCDFEVRQTNRTATHKGGGAKISLNTVSGSIRIRER
ncbi:MAG: DUF4097 domain-containing protein [Oscillospiraceae bacterium]|nr:DUF4097 domain-containing protein [Oscillospiraceae bacterium]